MLWAELSFSDLIFPVHLHKNICLLWIHSFIYSVLLKLFWRLTFFPVWWHMSITRSLLFSDLMTQTFYVLWTKTFQVFLLKTLRPKSLKKIFRFLLQDAPPEIRLSESCSKTENNNINNNRNNNYRIIIWRKHQIVFVQTIFDLLFSWITCLCSFINLYCIVKQ